MEKLFSEIGVVLTGIIGLAIIAVLVGQNARTASVIRESGRAFTGALRAATGPVTGGYSGGGGFGI